MPNLHSSLFNELVNTHKREQRIDPAALKKRLTQKDSPLSYTETIDLLREVNDAQFGIVSTKGADGEWVRDATDSLPLHERMPHDSAIIEANNMLMRVLSRLRPIDYAIGQKIGAVEGDKISMLMRHKFAELTQEILSIDQKTDFSNAMKLQKIQEAETLFNDFLIQQLHEANLTSGVTDKAGAEKLLFHYRNLSSVLEPAQTMVTLTYDKANEVLSRETQYPVTEKRPKQREIIEKLSEITPFPVADEKNSHTKLNHAMQEADSLFQSKIVANDTMLPAQARKTHIAGAKNAFIVKSELIFGVRKQDLQQNYNKPAKKEDTLWLARFGSPAFLGKGEEEAIITAQAGEVLDQIRLKAQEVMGSAQPPRLHVTTLNTDTSLENQSTIVRSVATATKNKGDTASYIPTNWHGTFHDVKVSKELNFDKPGTTRPSGSAPSQKAKRVQEAASVMLKAAELTLSLEAEQANSPEKAARLVYLSGVHCASAQDRTGTVIEKTQQDWMKNRYDEHEINNDNTARQIEITRAEGGNAAEIASHMIPGSPGMKSESQAGDTFGEDTSAQWYRKSAATNKKNKVHDVSFLENPSNRSLQEYNKKLTDVTTALNALKTPKYQQLIEKTTALMRYVSTMRHPSSDHSLSAKTVYHLTQILDCTAKTLTKIEDPKATKKNVATLAKLSEHISEKSTLWKKISTALLLVGCAALVCVGLLAAIPSLGSSLILSAVGVVGIATGVAAKSYGYVKHGQEGALAEEVSKYKAALKELNAPSSAAPTEPEGPARPK